MPTRQQVEQAIHTHFDAWNRGERARWCANFADDIVFEDPVGGPVKTGRGAVELSWDNSFSNGQTWTIEPVLLKICRNEAALHVRSRGCVNGVAFELDGIEIYTIDDDGKVAYVKTWFEPPAGVALDPYFMQAHAAAAP